MPTIYDAVKDEIGPGPAYASRTDFTSYYGYSKGVALGTYPNRADADAAGATKVEKAFDEAGYRAANAAYQAHAEKIMNAWYDRVRAEYPHVNDEVFKLVYGMAYDRAHSSGMGEVELYISDYVDFASAVIAAANK